jgi:hypothetical protein
MALVTPLTCVSGTDVGGIKGSVLVVPDPVAASVSDSDPLVSTRDEVWCSVEGEMVEVSGPFEFAVDAGDPTSLVIEVVDELSVERFGLPLGCSVLVVLTPDGSGTTVTVAGLVSSEFSAMVVPSPIGIVEEASSPELPSDEVSGPVIDASVLVRGKSDSRESLFITVLPVERWDDSGLLVLGEVVSMKRVESGSESGDPTDDCSFGFGLVFEGWGPVSVR